MCKLLAEEGMASEQSCQQDSRRWPDAAPTSPLDLLVFDAPAATATNAGYAAASRAASAPVGSVDLLDVGTFTNTASSNTGKPFPTSSEFTDLLGFDSPPKKSADSF